MQTYVITFVGEGIRNGWLEVQAYDENIARAWALREYGSNWSGIYTKEEFFDGDTSLAFSLGKIGETTIHYESAEHV